MRAWRRRSSGAQAPSTPTGPLVVSIVCDGSSDVEVNFDTLITWGGLNPATLTVNGDTMGWISQADVFRLVATGPANYDPGMSWTLPGPEGDIVPQPALAQSGLTT